MILYLNINLQEFSDNFGVESLYEKETNDKIFWGLEYINSIIREVGEFLIIGERLWQNDKKNPVFENDLLSAFYKIENMFDSHLALDYLIEKSPSRLVFNYDKEIDLF